MEERIEVVGANKAVRAAGGRYENKAEWVRRFKESGMSLRKFSAEHGLGYISLWRWVNRNEACEAGRSEVAFKEIKLPESWGSSDWAAELTLPNGAVLRLTKEVPPSMLEQLLGVC